MSKKKMLKKKVEVRYESDRVSRWNICQKIAKMLYRSDVAVETLEFQLNNLEVQSLKIKKKK